MGGSFYGDDHEAFREITGRRKITDTTKETLSEGGALGFLAAAMGSGGVGRAIEEQEAQGQHELVSSMQLPRMMGYEANARQAYEKLGFKFPEKETDDKLFVYAELPAGWKKVRTDHSMWSNILDEKGRVRVEVFYKAAFYDRDAHMSLSGRFTTKSYNSKYEANVPADRDGKSAFIDKATGAELFLGTEDDCREFRKQYLEGKDPYDFDAVYE
jgi:hypothetical protein